MAWMYCCVHLGAFTIKGPPKIVSTIIQYKLIFCTIIQKKNLV